MGRNRLDFVGPGEIAGQIARVDLLASREHKGLRDGWDDEGNFAAVEYTYTLPGIEARISLRGHPFTYRVRAIVGEDGRPQLAELHIDQPAGEPDVPITADDLRKLAKYLDRLAYAAVEGPRKLASATEFHQPEKKRPGRRGHGEKFYAEIAEYAMQAHRNRHRTGESVRQAIATHYKVSLDTADKWLSRARKAGHLKPGDLGGQPKARKDTTR